jgi:hypothetical protein
MLNCLRHQADAMLKTFGVCTLTQNRTGRHTPFGGCRPQNHKVFPLFFPVNRSLIVLAALFNFERVVCPTIQEKLMRMALIACLCAPVLAIAQAGFPTEFPVGATPLQRDDLQKKLAGRVVQMTYANGAEVRLEFKDTYAYVNSGKSSDTGTWRVQESQLCIDWQRFPSGCSDVRVVSELLYVKRVTNGEIVQMVLK